jgi:hypothetical protein
MNKESLVHLFHILIIGGYESESFDWSSDVPSSQII